MKIFQAKYSSFEKDEKKLLSPESPLDSNGNLLQSQIVNFNAGASTSNLTISSINIAALNPNYINKSNESVIINQSNKNNNNVKSHFGSSCSNAKKIINNEKNEISIETNNVNKTFSNINPQMKTTLDFSQIRADTENSIIFSNKDNVNNNVNSLKDNKINLNIMKVKLFDAEAPAEEDMLDQKNAKIMLKSKFF